MTSTSEADQTLALVHRRPPAYDGPGPDAVVLRVSGGWIETAGPNEVAARWRPAGGRDDGRLVVLGEYDGREHWALLQKTPDEGSYWAELSALMAPWDHPRAEDRLVRRAVAMAHWHEATRFCPRCGDALAPGAAGTVLVCARGHREHPRIDCAVIMLVTDGEPGSPAERCLLGRRTGVAEPRYSALAGFCEPGEALEDAVRREVVEETAVGVGSVAYVASQSWPMPGSLMVGYLARATSTEIRVDPEELSDARWFTRADLARLEATGALTMPGHHTLSRALIEGWRRQDLTTDAPQRSVVL